MEISVMLLATSKPKATLPLKKTVASTIHMHLPVPANFHLIRETPEALSSHCPGGDALDLVLTTKHPRDRFLFSETRLQGTEDAKGHGCSQQFTLESIPRISHEHVLSWELHQGRATPSRYVTRGD